MDVNVYVFRSYSGSFTNDFKNNNYIGIDWFNNDPFIEKWDLLNKTFLIEKYSKLNPQIQPKVVGLRISSLFRFINELLINDIIICPYSNGSLLIGTIASELYFVDNTKVKWRRGVKWIKDNVDRSIYSTELKNALRSSQIFYKIKQNTEVLHLL